MLSETDVIFIIMIFFFVQTLCLRHFWLYSEELEDENKELRQRLKDAGVKDYEE